MINNVIVGSFIVALGWSLFPILYKIILKDIPAETLFLLYYITAGTILSFYVFFNWNHLNFNVTKMSVKDVVLLFIAVLTGSIVANYFHYRMLKENQAYLVTILTSVSPIITILIAYFYLDETINFKQWIGIILAVIGITLTVL